MGKNKCKWISRGKTTNCPTNLCREKKYCHIHKFVIKTKGRVNKICSVCLIGIRGTNGLCRKHGAVKARNKKNNSVRDELNRLENINID